MHRTLTPLLAGWLLASFATAAAQDPPLEALRAEGLEALLQEFRAHVDQPRNTEWPGVVLLVSRGGRTELLEALSVRRLDGKDVDGGYRPDTIFKLGSMTMPIAAAAALTFVEEGRLALDDPVSRYLPEFASVRVWPAAEAENEVTITRPPAREVCIADLLTLTSGLSRELFGEREVGEHYRGQVWYLEQELLGDSSRGLARMLANLPLEVEPGTAWAQDSSFDVLGAVLEKIEARSLQEILDERIFTPLGMVDTAFFLPEPKQERLAPWLVAASLGSATRMLITLPPLPPVASSRPSFCSGGHGLFSTAGDCLRFCEMLLGAGAREGVRILSAESVALITTDRIAGLPRLTALPRRELASGLGFGMGVAVWTAQSPEAVGSYGWANSGGCFFVDPAEQLIGILLNGPWGGPYLPATVFHGGVYAALPVDPDTGTGRK